jgi:hypothetical protein
LIRVTDRSWPGILVGRRDAEVDAGFADRGGSKSQSLTEIVVDVKGTRSPAYGRRLCIAAR